jgi:hypothetical protein
MSKIEPQNLTAQLNYRARGNPVNSQPVSAISNCFPGLEMDFRAIWRRMFKGIVLVENNNYVIEIEDDAYKHLLNHRLIRIDEYQTGVVTTGVVNPSFPPGPISTGGNPNGVSFMEWSNSLARIMSKQGQKVRCGFTREASETEVLYDKDKDDLIYVEMTLRHFFEIAEVAGKETPLAVIARALVEPGELTQGLCSPWQNDYRECACYYWAATRPDYINVEDTPTGESRGDNWMAKIVEPDPLHYVLDDRKDERLLSYDDLFRDWQGELRFIVGGSNAKDIKDAKDGG